MKEILVLLVLLTAQTTKVCSQPYHADADGKCLNSTTEYLLDGSNLCCKKCHPGQRVVQECTETTESVCRECPTNQYMESWNYFLNCFSCPKCKISKGLQEAQRCSSTSRSRCGCQPGKYCIMEIGGKHCKECENYSSCKAGYGVSSPGTGNSNVKCERCPNGTFSDKVLHLEPCQPHTNCYGRVIVKKGDATSDTVCGSPDANMQSPTPTKNPPTEMLFTTTTTTTTTTRPATAEMSTVIVTSTTPQGPPDYTLSLSPSVSKKVFNYSTKPPTLDSLLPAVIASVIGLLFFMAVILLVLCKQHWKKDAAICHPEVDANGNCEMGDKINQGYLRETQPLMTLIPNMESFSPQSSVPTQSSSQPTSPQDIRPLTTNPVVNITVHIGNGSCGTPTGMPIESKLQLREEEELLSIPQQEAGKQSLMSVQESKS
ncbi:tumor necrosis factor receptor superfamily member 1B isoform X1 [Eleginops maclovinus]|uniref:tumor necrosis factor receptor superfamily member 1B isoform X1 n=1 Tax=Eleginops maclovinus TaxID=56733 RepID=UPI0030800278